MMATITLLYFKVSFDDMLGMVVISFARIPSVMRFLLDMK